MFRIEFSTTDKNVGEALKRLHGLATQIEYAYVPDVLAPLRNGQAGEKPARDRTGLILAELHKRKLTEIKGPQLRELIAALGMNRTSSHHYTKNLIKRGALRTGKLIGNTMTYIVTGQ